MKKMSLKQSLQLVDVMARMRMKAQASRLMLSYVWWVLEPLLFVGVFYVVFEYILKRGGDDFFVFLIVGKVVFMWFSKSLMMSSNSLRANFGIIAQRSMPKWIFPLSTVHEAFYKSMLTFAIMLFLLAVTGKSNPGNWIYLLPVIISTYLFIVGVSFLISIIVTLIQDFSQIISLIVMGFMFGSGVFWDINKLGDDSLENVIMLLNPLAALIDSYRTVIILNEPVVLGNLGSSIFFGFLFLFISVVVFDKFNNKITRSLYS